MNVNLKSLILEHLEEGEKILITGASGWLGRETIELLAELLGNQFSSKVVLAGSRSRLIKVNKTDYSVIAINSISQDSLNFGIILHLAFLSQDKVEQFGAKKYTDVNEEITNLMLQMTLMSGAKYVFVASSGAAAAHILENQKHSGKKLYGELKLNAENRFLALTSVQVLIGRIWSISGNQIQEPLKYAIGNFIHQAVSTGSITLVGSLHSTRTYIDAKQMMTGYIFQLLTSKDFLLNSGGATTNMLTLADQVLLKYSPAGSLFRSEQREQLPDFYVSPDNEMKEILSRYSIELFSLEQQIRNTGFAIVFD
jgi:nucleoside-diphosphate-sugar epimerase